MSGELVASVEWPSEEQGAGGRRRQGVHMKGTDKKEDTGRGGGGETEQEHTAA